MKRQKRPRLPRLRRQLGSKGCFGPTTVNCVNRGNRRLSFWGDRVLEDDWRQSNKFANLFADDGDEEGSDEQGEEEVLDPLDPTSLPTFDELLASLHTNRKPVRLKKSVWRSCTTTQGWTTAKN